MLQLEHVQRQGRGGGVDPNKIMLLEQQLHQSEERRKEEEKKRAIAEGKHRHLENQLKQQVDLYVYSVCTFKLASSFRLLSSFQTMKKLRISCLLWPFLLVPIESGLHMPLVVGWRSASDLNLAIQSPFKYANMMKGKKGPPAHMPDIAEGREMQQGVGPGPAGMIDAVGVRSPSVSCSSTVFPILLDAYSFVLER